MLEKVAMSNYKMWAENIANKHNISIETVNGIYNSFKEQQGKRKRVEMLLDLYFEGRNSDGKTK